MKKLFIFLLSIMIFLLSVMPLAQASTIRPMSPFDQKDAKNIEKTVTMKRGGSVTAWVFPFKTKTDLYLPDEGNDHVFLKAVKLSGTKGNISISLSGSTDWISAKLKSNKITFKVKGKNATLKDKVCMITIKDSKGVFGTITVTRGGVLKLSAIKQVGKNIQLNISGDLSRFPMCFIARLLFDEKGNKISQDNFQIYENTFTDDTEVKKGYTYAYRICYFPNNINSTWSCYAAAIKIQKASGSAVGKTKIIVDDDQLGFNEQWLFDLAK